MALVRLTTCREDWPNDVGFDQVGLIDGLVVEQGGNEKDVGYGQSCREVVRHGFLGHENVSSARPSRLITHLYTLLNEDWAHLKVIVSSLAPHSTTSFSWRAV